jgi:hypothetical protein
VIDGPTNTLSVTAVAGREPCQVTGLSANLVDSTVELDWAANPEDDGQDPGNLAYDVYRDGRLEDAPRSGRTAGRLPPPAATAATALWPAAHV